ncbi:NAD(P)H-binding protein [Magnetovibrio sp.]|uniref:NmrA family NAD(P)-binding protein n=1 Tax=Magnetovibrio sp. TaxID=2024836 RepID=UPI002F936EA4
MNTPSHANTILVLGGTGKTGRRIAERLIELGYDTRIGSRSAPTPFDWLDRDTWLAAVRGVNSVYVSYFPDLAVPGAVETVQAFTDVAVSCGVQKLVLLSGRGEEEAERAEDVIKNSGVNWTILRASWFSQNFNESFLLDAVRSGVIALPVSDIGEPFIDVEDIADVAVAALTETGHAGQLYELTGPRLLTFADVAREISAASGRPVRFEYIDAALYIDGLHQHGIDQNFIDLLMYLFNNVLNGRNAYTTDGVQRALGRAPRDFAQYAKDTAATGVWDAPALQAALA